MKRSILIFVLLAAVLATAACQVRYDSPQSVAWDRGPTADADDVGIRLYGSTDVIILSEGNLIEEEFIDLEALGLYGVYEVVVRGVVYTPPDESEVTDWVGSTDPAAVIEVGGSPHTFLIRRRKPAGDTAKPGMLRIE